MKGRIGPSRGCSGLLPSSWERVAVKLNGEYMAGWRLMNWLRLWSPGAGWCWLFSRECGKAPGVPEPQRNEATTSPGGRVCVRAT